MRRHGPADDWGADDPQVMNCSDCDPEAIGPMARHRSVAKSKGENERSDGRDRSTSSYEGDLNYKTRDIYLRGSEVIRAEGCHRHLKTAVESWVRSAPTVKRNGSGGNS
jgi:hypothetical protein